MTMTIDEFREWAQRGQFLRSIAGSFGISTSQVRNIVTGKSWRIADVA